MREIVKTKIKASNCCKAQMINYTAAGVGKCTACGQTAQMTEFDYEGPKYCFWEDGRFNTCRRCVECRDHYS